MENTTGKPTRLFIIGRLIKANNRIEAYKVYLDTTKEISIVDAQKVINLVKTKQPIVVLGLTTNGRTKDKNGYIKVKENQYLYSMREIDKINGFGEPLNPSGKKIIVNVKGYREAATYNIIDVMGNEEELNHAQFIELLKDNKLIGAKMDARGLIKIYKWCDTRRF